MKSSYYNLSKKWLTHTYNEIRVYTLVMNYKFWVIMHAFEEVLLSSNSNDIVLWDIVLK